MRRAKMYGLILARKKAGLTQSQLAEAIGVRKNAISCYETGERYPAPKIRDRLEKYFGCEFKELL